MGNYHRLTVAFLVLMMIGSVWIYVGMSGFSAVHGANEEIRIFGLVNNPLNLSYAKLLSFPKVSETTNLECVFGLPNVTLHWTGVPLFHLLTLAQVKPQGREVIFRAPDGFSSSIPMEEALQPTVILALMANGTHLWEVDQVSDIQGGIRIVVPCKWGYKWVTYIQEIEVIDYDYKGTYESSSFSDEADIPGCPYPQILPPLETFAFPFGNRLFEVKVFTNISISSLNFNYLQKEINLSVTVPPEKTGFSTVILEQTFLQGPYSVLLDGSAFEATQSNTTGLSFLYLEIPTGLHTIEVAGTKFFGTVPDIKLRYNQTALVGKAVTFDASESVDDGQIIFYEWNLGDGTTTSGAIVNHAYTEEGTYQILVNLTDNDGLSSTKTFEITVANQPNGISNVVKIILASTFGFVLLTMIILVLRRMKKVSGKPVTSERADISTRLFLTPGKSL